MLRLKSLFTLVFYFITIATTASMHLNVLHPHVLHPHVLHPHVLHPHVLHPHILHPSAMPSTSSLVESPCPGIYKCQQLDDAWHQVTHSEEPKDVAQGEGE